MKRYFIGITSLIVASFALCTEALAQSRFKVRLKLPSSGAEDLGVNAISRLGRVFPGTKSGSNISFSIPTASLKGTSFYAVDGGRLLGPLVAPLGEKGLIFLGKKPTNLAGQALKSLKLKLKAQENGENYVRLQSVKGKVFDKKYKYTLSAIPAYGLNTPSSSGQAQALLRAKAGGNPPGDSDGDGVVDRLDTDADGDGINNIADSNTEVNGSVSKLDASSIDIPFTALYLDMNSSVNWHIGGALSASEIDAVIGGENIFTIAFFFGLPAGDTSGITGGHVICGSNLRYCRPTVGSDTGSGIYSGFSEGNQSLIGQLWSDLRTDGSEYSLEAFSVSGSTDLVYAASIQPRVGTEFFRPGDNYRVDFTDADGDVVTSSTLTLPPYFLTAPVLRSYNTTGNDSSGDVLVDYSDSNGPGTNNSNPIVLATTGDFAGKLRLTAYRLQRLAVGDESSIGYMDYGHLNYGISIDNNAGEFSCGELYSSLSSTLTEVASRGTGDSFRTGDGANLWPLVDSADDYEPSSATDNTTVGNNTISLTIDLAGCLDRNGLSPGVHNVNLFAAGVNTGHGANRAAQRFTVNIP
ncbi:MAG: hypothetical protein DCC75_11865 [Proteobacteria bacterium]|nr:MAG: hypothetical protein DCC75_11865 [Pseudomonadota bacterium]